MAKSRARKLADIIVGAGIDIDGNLTFDGGSTSADLTFADNDKANFGDASDLQIFHNGSHSFIKDAGTGDLYIGASNNLALMNSAFSENYLLATTDGAVNLYYDGSSKLTTTSTGVTVTGQLTASTNLIATTATYSPIVYGGSSNLQLKSNTAEMFAQFVNNGAAELYYDNSKKFETFSGGVSVTGQLNATTMHLPDGGTGLQIGNSNDLTIFHDGTDSFIKNDTGQLILRVASVESALVAVPNGAVSLYYDNSAKLATTSTGVDVTGTVTADGAEVIGDVAINTTTPATYLHIVPTDGELNDVFEGFRVSRSASLKAAQYSTYSHAGGAATITSTVTTNAASGSFRVLSSADGSTTKSLLHISNGNDVSFYEDTGTTAKLFWDASAESLGIGTTSPSKKLHVDGVIGSQNSTQGTGFLELQGYGNQGYINNSGSSSLFFRMGSSYTTRMTLTNAGNLGIGTTAPANKLHVRAGASGATTFDSRYNTIIEDDGENYLALYTPNNSFSGVRFVNADNSIRGHIDYYHGTQGDKFVMYSQEGWEFTYPSYGVQQVLKKNGNVGIRATNPPHDLTVYNASGPTLYLVGGGYNDDVRIAFGGGDTTNTSSDGNTGAQIISTQSAINGQARGDLRFLTNQGDSLQTRLVIEEAGNVGINNSNPAGLLSLSKGTRTLDLKLETTPATGDVGVQFRANSGAYLGLAAGGGTGIGIVVDSSNNVGIGTTSPTNLLHIKKTGFTRATVEAGGSNQTGIQIKRTGSSNDTDWEIYSPSSGTDLRFYNGGDRVTLNASGNVGIGTTSPGRKLTVQGGSGDNLPVRIIGGSGTSHGSLEFQDPNTTADYKVTIGSKADDFYIQAGGGEKVRILANGNVGIGKTNPLQPLNVHGRISSNLATADHYYGAWLDGNSTSGQDSFLGLGPWHNDAGYVKFIQSGTPHRLSIYTANTSDHVTLQESGGKVGIGTASPAQTLHVDSSSGAVIRVSRIATSAGAYGQLEHDGTDTTLTSTGATKFYNNSGYSLTIDSSNNVGIGNTNPSAYGKFVVSGAGNILNLNATSGVAYQAFYENGTGRFYFGTLNGSDGLAFIDADGATKRMVIDDSGRIGIGVTPNGSNDMDDVILQFPSNYAIGGAYSSFGETASGQSTIIGNNIRAEVGANNQVVRHISGSDAGNFLKLTYNQGFTIHTGITSTLGTGVDHTINERVRVDTSGNVGIGTTSPSRTLDVIGDFGVKKGSSAIAFNEYSNGATIWLDGSNGDFTGGDYFNISAYGTTDLVFGYAGGTHITMKNDGKLGIGTTSPGAKLHIRGQNPSGLIVENGVGNAPTQPYVSMAANNYSSGYGTFRWEDQRASQASPSFIWEVHDGSGSVLAYDFRTGATGASGSKLAITQDGKVGIGTTTINSTLTVGTTSSAECLQLNGGANGNATVIEMVDSKAGAYSSITVEVQLPGAGGYFYEIQTGSASVAASQTGGGYTNGTSNFGHTLNFGSNWTVSSPSNNLVRFVTTQVGTHPVVRIKIGCGLSAGLDQTDVTFTYTA